LVKLDAHFDWEIFGPPLRIVVNKSGNRNKMGHPSFDRAMMFKIIIVQSLYSLPPKSRGLMKQIADRFIFKRIYWLQSSNRVFKIRTLLDNPALRTQYGKAGRRKVSNMYNQHKNNDLLVEHFKNEMNDA
jgi:hypothetical protein